MKKRIEAILLCMLLIVSSLVIVFPVESVKANGITLYVGGSGPGNYTSIQNAVDNASSRDIVFVYPGIYYENIVINKPIHLMGKKNENTIIDGGKNRTAVLILSDYVDINNFTICNSGHNFYDDMYDMDAGLTIKSNKINVSDNIFIDNYIGILLFNTSNNYLYKNKFLNNGGCIFNINTTFTQIINNSFTNTVGILCGGINNNTIKFNVIHNAITFSLYASNCFYSYIENNTITGDDGFGILVVNSSQNNICYNSVSINNPRTYESFKLEDSCNNIIKGNQIYESRWNGMVFLSSSNNSIIENKLTNNSNSGLAIAYSSNNHIENNEIINTDGDSISVYGNSKYNIIKNNYISGFKFEGSGSLSSGIFIEWDSYENEIISNTIISHSSHGIDVYTDNNSIIGNLIKNNSHNGIHLRHANTNLISNNIIIQNDYGVYLEEGSDNNQIFKNSIIKNIKSGIFIESYFGIYSNNNSIFSNNFIRNEESAHIQLNGNIWNRNYWDRPRILPFKIIDEKGNSDIDNFPRFFPVNIDNTFAFLSLKK